MFVLISLCVKLKKNKITDEACVAEGAGWWWWWRPGRIAVGGGQDARKWVFSRRCGLGEKAKNCVFPGYFAIEVQHKEAGVTKEGARTRRKRYGKQEA